MPAPADREGRRRIPAFGGPSHGHDQGCGGFVLEETVDAVGLACMPGADR